MKNVSLCVHYDSPEADAVQLEVSLDQEPILFGIWDVDIKLKGKKLKTVDSWTETCSINDNECEYLELDIPMDHGYRLQRHFLLDYADQLLILADTVLWEGEQKRKSKPSPDAVLDYCSTLFYSPKLKAKPTPEATELTFLSKNTSLFRVMPLALPEWTKSKPEGLVRGHLGIEDAKLVLRQQTSGKSLFAPLFFDLNQTRLKSQYTWRHLTVGEKLEQVPDDQAVGYRIQMGKEQFLLYHSMPPMANRTVLGHNLIDDFCFARFHPETGVDTLVTVQQEVQ